MSVIGHGVEIIPSALQRPTSPAEGTLIYQLDNHKSFIYNGSSWIEINDLDNTGAASDGLITALTGKMNTGSYISAHGGLVYGNMYAGTSGAVTKNIGTVTHNFGTGNYSINLTPWTTNAYNDGFSANAQSRTSNSFAIIISRVGGSGWGDTGVYCSYFAWRW